MDLSLNPDQVAILDALDALAKPYAGVPIGDHSLALTSAELDREIAQGGFLDVAFDPELGVTTAAIIVERLARLPFATEAAMSAIVRPLLGDAIGSSLCLVEQGHPNRPLRYLCAGASVIVLGDRVGWFTASTAQVRAEPEALYGYPVATLLDVPASASHSKCHRTNCAPVGGSRSPPKPRVCLPPRLRASAPTPPSATSSDARWRPFRRYAIGSPKRRYGPTACIGWR